MPGRQLPPERFEVQDTSSFSPLLVIRIFLDADRCYASLFAGTRSSQISWSTTASRGDAPTMTPTPCRARDLPQRAYADAFIQIAERTKKYDNVIGYDLMNEPLGVFVMSPPQPTARAAPKRCSPLVSLLPADEGELPTDDAGVAISEVPTEAEAKAAGSTVLKPRLRPLCGDPRLGSRPPDSEPETLQARGRHRPHGRLGAQWPSGQSAQPFYEFVGKAIQEVDENATIWIEPATSLRMITGASQFFDMPMTRPGHQPGRLRALVPDIYPRPGLAAPSSSTPMSGSTETSPITEEVHG